MEKLIKCKKIRIIILILILLILSGGLIILIKDNKNSSENNLHQGDDKEELKSEINNDEQELNESIDYTNLEKVITEASIIYVNENYSFTEKEIIEEIDLSLLVKNNYIKDKNLLKLYSDEICDAYSIVEANVLETTGKTFLKCKNYITDGYNDNHLNNEANEETNNEQSVNDDVNNSYNSSENSKQYAVENYVGKNYLAVKKQLESVNLKVIVETKDISDMENFENISGETIIEQSVDPGKILLEGESITLYIPRVVASYPNFCDGSYTVDKVQKFADNHNLILTIQYEDNYNYEEGRIFYQSKVIGTDIVEGTRLIIKVAK